MNEKTEEPPSAPKHDCESCQNQLIDYHFGELEAAARRDIAAHLTSCSRCALEYCRLHADLTGLGDSLIDGPRRETELRLRDRVERTFRPPWWRRLLRLGAAPVPAYQTALVVVGLLLVWFLVVAPGLDPGRSGKAKSMLTDYDASVVLRVDPNTL
jgi:anti-sigma factor RsiW